jgi:hypothetical protein
VPRSVVEENLLLASTELQVLCSLLAPDQVSGILGFWPFHYLHTQLAITRINSEERACNRAVCVSKCCLYASIIIVCKRTQVGR